MKWNLRRKLILSIGLPLLAVYLVVVAADYQRTRALAFERTAAQLTDLAASHAAVLENHLQDIVQLGRTNAAFLAAQDTLSEAQIYATLEGLVRMEPMVFGAAVAFAPDAFAPGRARFAPYVYRHGLRLIHLDIGKNAHDYTQLPWYQQPLQTARGVWIDAYYDADAGNVLKCTYATPLYRREKLLGVATVDVALSDVQRLVKPSDFKDQVFVLVSSTGKFILHPDSRFNLRESLMSVSAPEQMDLVAQMIDKVADGEAGVVSLEDFPLPGRHLVLFAPVRSTNWSFITAAPEAAVMAPVYAELRHGPLIMLLALLCILGIVYVASARITKPLVNLNAAVSQVGAGNLRTSVPVIASRDELGQLSAAFNQMVRNLEEQMAALQRETARREKIESELAMARTIQSSLLPAMLPVCPEFHLSAVNIPARQVAGDFYDFFFVRDDLLTIVVADVSGKGVPAALFMAVTRTVLRDLAHAGKSPAEIFQQANEILARDNRRSLFVTAWIGQYDINTGVLCYANCGHPPPYLLNRHGVVEPCGEVTGPLLGVIDADIFGQVEEKPITLQPGETLLLYTDGIPEAISPEGEFFREKRFRRLLTDLLYVPVEQLCDLTIKGVDQFQGELSADDRTLVALHRYK